MDRNFGAQSTLIERLVPSLFFPGSGYTVCSAVPQLQKRQAPAGLSNSTTFPRQFAVLRWNLRAAVTHTLCSGRNRPTGKHAESTFLNSREHGQERVGRSRFARR